MATHYIGMNALTSKYGEQGLVVLGFPCNIFLYQEPGSNATEILNGVKYVRPGGGFEPNFQLFTKIEVNGAKEHVLYTYLKKHCPATTTEFVPSMLMYSPIRAGDVMWNWETFLVDHRGRVIRRAPPPTEPKELEGDIEAALADAAEARRAGRKRGRGRNGRVLHFEG